MASPAPAILSAPTYPQILQRQPLHPPSLKLWRGKQWHIHILLPSCKSIETLRYIDILEDL